MFFSSFLVVAGLLAADTADTLQTAVVVADRGMVVSRSDTVRISNQLDITEALSRMPAFTAGDMGGAAGLKTVNLRGLGSPHTAIYVDGVRISNVQSGQTDLGMLDLGSCSRIVVDYAQNSLSFCTSKPEFGSRKFAGSVKFRGGSFGTYEPAARLDFKLSDKVSLSVMSSGTVSKGDFRYGENSRRENNDIGQVRAGVDLWGLMENGSWHTKAYYNGSKRGTPGTIDWPSADRQKDRNVYVQGVVQNRFTSRYTLNASAKASYDDLLYSSEWGDSRYRVTGFQLNSSHIFRVASWADVSIAADISRDDLKATDYDAGRTSVVSVATVMFRLPGFKADVAVEYSGTFDKGSKGINTFSPSADICYTITEGLDITAFGRRSCRVPTFNELYYPGFGNPNLECEDAWLASLGPQWRKSISDWSVEAGVDFNFNSISNKIVSAPSVQDPSLWFPYNIGKALMYGADAKTGAAFRKGDWAASLSVAYIWQDTKDKTPGSASFNEQIPFVSRHSLTVNLNGTFRGFSLDFLWNLRCGRRDSYSEMPDYNTLDMNFGKRFEFGKGGSLALKFLARNLTDTRYELSSGYPMPGRAFYGSIEYNF